MASVSETELEQKTSEYINFVKEHFTATERNFYNSHTMSIGVDNDGIILEYRGK